MSWVWPRLPRESAVQLLAEVCKASPVELRSNAELDHPDAAPVAVGGRPAHSGAVEKLRQSLRDLSDEHGFPETLHRSVGRFDRPAARLLHETMDVVPADAASEDVWNFVSLVVAPDVAVWRYPDRARDRLLGHPQRNVFRRLWMRAETIGVDLVDTDDGLGEDEFVNIMERTSIAADRRLAVELAAAIVELKPPSGVARSEVMRDASKRVLRTQALLCLDVLSIDELRSMVDGSVNAAVIGIGSA